MTDKHGLSSNVVETVAGFTAGVVSTLAVHPLDIIKTRLQGDDLPTRLDLTMNLQLTKYYS